MAAGAVGASMMAEALDAMEPLLTCRPDVLGLLMIDPDLDGLDEVVFGCIVDCPVDRAAPPAWGT